MPLALELAVEAAPVGEAGKAVEARQLLEVLIGDLQFLLARRELARHVVERGGKRLEFGNPGLIAGAYVQIAAAEARRRAHQRPDRAHDEPLAAEPGGEQNKHAEQAKLHVGDADLAVDAAVHDALVEADRKPRMRPGHADIGRRCAGRRRSPAIVVVPSSLRQHLPRQGVVGEVLADESPASGRSGR